MQGLHVSYSVSPRESGVYSGAESKCLTRSPTQESLDLALAPRGSSAVSSVLGRFSKAYFTLHLEGFFFPAVLPSLISRMTIG